MTSVHPIEGEVDLAVVGAGIGGLALALEGARRGLRVAVLERSPRALGASVRNFGMILPLGASPGAARARAMASRAVWLELARTAGFWHAPVGSLFVANAPDELEVMRQFAASAPDLGYDCEVVSAAEAARRCPALAERAGLGALAGPDEVIVDPREAIPSLAAHLARAHGVRFEFGSAVTVAEPPELRAAGRRWRAGRIAIAGGIDFETLFPALFAASGLVRCKLQMLRTRPMPGLRLGPMLGTALSLLHYPAFAACPSLPELRARTEREQPELLRRGIHVMACQNGLGELTLGDSHEYGEAAESPFDSRETDRLILEEIDRRLFPVGRLELVQSWHGVYAKHPSGAPLVPAPDPSVRIVAGFGGAGMTTAFGLAREVFDAWGES